MSLGSCRRSIAKFAAQPKRQARGDAQSLLLEIINAILVMELRRWYSPLAYYPYWMESRWRLFETEYGSRGVHSFGILRADCVELFACYLPGQWYPHIYVAMDDLCDADVSWAIQEPRAYHPRCHHTLSNTHLVQLNRKSGRIEVIYSYALRR